MDFYPDLEGLPLFAKPAFGWEDSVSAAPADPPSAKRANGAARSRIGNAATALTTIATSAARSSVKST